LTAIVRRIASIVSPADCRIRLTRAEEARRFLCQHSEPCSETGHTRERRDLIRRIELFRARTFAGWPTDFGSNPRERDRVSPNDVYSVIPGPAQIRGKFDKRIVAIRSDERRIIALGYRFHYQRVLLKRGCFLWRDRILCASSGIGPLPGIFPLRAPLKIAASAHDRSRPMARLKRSV